MTRDRNAGKLTFDWAIGPPKYGCEVVESVLGFNQKYLRFYFGHDVFEFFDHQVASNKNFDGSRFSVGSILVDIKMVSSSSGCLLGQ